MTYNFINFNFVVLCDGYFGVLYIHILFLFLFILIVCLKLFKILRVRDDIKGLETLS